MLGITPYVLVQGLSQRISVEILQDKLTKRALNSILTGIAMGVTESTVKLAWDAATKAARLRKLKTEQADTVTGPTFDG